MVICFQTFTRLSTLGVLDENLIGRESRRRMKSTEEQKSEKNNTSGIKLYFYTCRIDR